MTNEIATKVLKRIQYGTTYPVYEALDMAIEALQQGCEKAAEGCDDLISRQDVIDAIMDLSDCENGYSDTYDKAQIIGVLEDLPSAQP